MLEPELHRLCYGEQLTSPVEFKFDSAITTSYSLDLNALLAVPVALCFNNTLDGDLKGEKLALLEAIGQLKGRLKVFYQKGNISCPPQFNRLFTLLEPCLHPVVPDGGAFSSFHPKLWLLRFIEREPQNKKPKVCYRLIVLSRNLTFDRSWDVAVSLDGHIDKAKANSAKNKDWLEFVKSLLKQDESFAPASTMIKELDEVSWELPEGFADLRMLIGGGNYSRPVYFEHERYDELMVVSPFIRSSGGGISALEWLQGFAPEGHRFLFSRAHELNAIGPEKLAGWKCYAMNEFVVNGEERNEIFDSAAGEEPKKQDLHAKLIVQRLANSAFWHIGSANATAAAIGDSKNPKPRNTEAMLMLTGSSDKIGPQVLMQQWLPEKGPQLFVSHEFDPIEVEENDSATRLLRQAIHQLISASWRLHASLDSQKTFSLKLQVDSLQEPMDNNVSVSVEQLAIPGCKPLSKVMLWEHVELTKISSLIPVTVKIDNSDLEQRLVIEAKLEIEGGDTRHQHIMKEIIDTPEKVLNYIRLLLQVTPDKNQWLSFDSQGTGGSGDFIFSGNPIFEPLLLASSRYPEILKRIDETLKRLKTAEVEIPEAFLQLWKHFEKEIH